MTYKIDKAVPMPARKRKPKYPIADMEIGDSFFVPTGPFTKAQDAAWATIRSSIGTWRTKTGNRHASFTSRVITEAAVLGNPGRTGVRVWRVADRVATIDGRGIEADKVPASAKDMLDRALRDLPQLTK